MKKAFQLFCYITYSILAFGIAYYAINYFIELSNPQNAFQQKLAQYTLVAPIHFIFGAIALFATPFQLSKKLRSLSIPLHRKLGYVYAVSVLLSGVAGLFMAFKASGGWVAQLGFFCLAVYWLLSTSLAVLFALKGKIAQHKKWIYRSVALTAAAITLRIFLGLGLGLFQLPFMTVYVPTAWLCWTINSVICEWILYQRATGPNL